MDGELKCPLSCGHWIHVECVIKSGKKECPMCKSALKFNQEQEKSYKKHKKELRMKQEMDEFADIVRNEVREIQQLAKLQIRSNKQRKPAIRKKQQ